MGFDRDGTNFVLAMRASGVRARSIAMIGRQRFSITPEALQACFRHFGEPLSVEEARRIMKAERGYAEPFLHRLGATEVVSVDASAYEGCSDIHDMNTPLPDRLRERFSLVVDGGSLEHVFNFPQAIRNCMEMVEVGGHLLLITPANNEMGHGFYQFSPELFCRVLCPANGFRIQYLLVAESGWRHRWHRVCDPSVLGRRVTLRNSGSTYLYVCAVRERVAAEFVVPQQSDYGMIWGRAADGSPGSGSPRRPGARARISAAARRWIPLTVADRVRRLRPLMQRSYNDSAFQRVDVRHLSSDPERATAGP